jgi:hypothetical protein
MFLLSSLLATMAAAWPDSVPTTTLLPIPVQTGAAAETFVPAGDSRCWYVQGVEPAFCFSSVETPTERLATKSDPFGNYLPNRQPTCNVMCRYTGRTQINADGTRSFDWEGTQMWIQLQGASSVQSFVISLDCCHVRIARVWSCLPFFTACAGVAFAMGLGMRRPVLHHTRFDVRGVSHSPSCYRRKVCDDGLQHDWRRHRTVFCRGE